MDLGLGWPLVALFSLVVYILLPIAFVGGGIFVDVPGGGMLGEVLLSPSVSVPLPPSVNVSSPAVRPEESPSEVT